MDILCLTAVELGKSIKAGRTTVTEAVRAVLDQIKAYEPILNSYITIDEEGAFKRAERVQRMIDEGVLAGPLAGVPAAIKDNLCMEGVRTTCGSQILSNFYPTYTAEAVKNLEKAGAVFLGKTNMDEFSMGSTTETSAFSAVKNPWNPEHVAGGSSGGSCAAVAALECFYALGTDTGGSIRQPCSFCGVTGIKPTYGTVSRYGLAAYGSSLDQIGPVARDVTDCAAVLEAISSYDRKDSTSLARNDCDFTSALIENVQGLRIGIPREYMGDGLNPEVREAVLAAARVLEQRGAVLEEFSLELTDYAVPAYYVIASAEASSNLARYDGVKYGHRAEVYTGLNDMYQRSRTEGFGSEAKRRIMLGTFVLRSSCYDTYFRKAMKARALVKKAFDQAFSSYDILLAPVSSMTAPRLGESLSDPLQMYLNDSYTVSANLAGLPAMSLPCGKDSKGLPIGMQLIGDCFQEKKLIRAAYTYEKSRTYEMPGLTTPTAEAHRLELI